MMKITEVFYSVQGEGSLCGVPSIFIRTAGCNLRCRWCDTPYSSWRPEGEEMTVEQVLESVATHPSRFVVITGGEPMIAREIHVLVARLSQLGKHITIETAGTIPPDGIACALASISPKLSNSEPGEDTDPTIRAQHAKNRLNLPVIRQWIQSYDFQLKFAVKSCTDVDEVIAFLSSLEQAISTERVMLMPEGKTVQQIQEHAPVVVDACKQYGYRFCDRLHLRLFGDKRGT